MKHEWLKGGFTGVDIFFVISGFVVTSSLLRKQYETPSALIVAFYSRRIKRLTPALLVMVTVASLVFSCILDPLFTSNFREYYYSGQLSLVGWANVHYASLPTGYFDEGAGALELNPFTHCWSLSVEEQFYFLFPALVVLAYGRQVWKDLRFLSTHHAPPLHTIRVSSTLPQTLLTSA